MAETIILDMNHPAVQHLCQKDKRLAKVISMVGTITYEPHDDGYSFLIHEIIEQMLSIQAGAKIYSRLIELCNGVITPTTVIEQSDEMIKNIGTSRTQVQYIKGITKAVIDGELNFTELSALSDEGVMKKLTSFKGIGQWTAKMYLIFVLNRQDILPYEDVAFLQSYKWIYKTEDCSKDSIKNKCKKINVKNGNHIHLLLRAFYIEH